MPYLNDVAFWVAHHAATGDTVSDAVARTYAEAHGYDYLPAFEAFTAQPDGGLSLVGADGIHPTTPPIGDLTVTSGARLWADTMQAAIVARSFT